MAFLLTFFVFIIIAAFIVSLVTQGIINSISSFYSLYEYFIGVNISDRYFPSTLKELGIKDTEHANLYTEEYRPYSLGSSYTNYFAVHHGFHIPRHLLGPLRLHQGRNSLCPPR